MTPGRAFLLGMAFEALLAWGFVAIPVKYRGEIQPIAFLACAMVCAVGAVFWR
jgi:hypothetical protein